MSRTVTITQGVQGYTTGSNYTLDNAVAAELVHRRVATYVGQIALDGDNGPRLKPLSASRNITAADDGASYYATTAITLTWPGGLNPCPTCTILPPPTGNLTIAFSGGATGNGAATAMTFTLAQKPAGVLITPWPHTADGYGVA